MAKTRLKNFRFDDDTLAILAAASKVGGVPEVEIARYAIAMNAMIIGVEHKRARQFLIDNLLQHAAAARTHKISPEHMFAQKVKGKP